MEKKDVLVVLEFEKRNVMIVKMEMKDDEKVEVKKKVEGKNMEKFF